MQCINSWHLTPDIYPSGEIEMLTWTPILQVFSQQMGAHATPLGRSMLSQCCPLSEMSWKNHGMSGSTAQHFRQDLGKYIPHSSTYLKHPQTYFTPRTRSSVQNDIVANVRQSICRVWPWLTMPEMPSFQVQCVGGSLLCDVQVGI